MGLELPGYSLLDTSGLVDGELDVLVIAGEHSGDQHAAQVVEDLFRLSPDLKVASLGGDQLAKAGSVSWFPLVNYSVVGLVEVLRHFGFFRRLFAEVITLVRERRPRILLLVDYPGFNLRLAAALRKAGLSFKGGGGVRVLFYISPQIWAWKAKRRFSMEGDLDALATIFPFEVACYEDTSLPVSFVGHPFLTGRENLPEYDAGGAILLLPGSRVKAVSRILPCMLEVIAALPESIQEKGFLLPVADEGVGKVVEETLRRSDPALAAKVELVDAHDPLRACYALMSSGTMSLKVSLQGIPGLVLYRAHPLTWMIGRRLVSIPWLGIANLVLKQEAYPEFLQGDAKASKVSRKVQEDFKDPDRTRKEFLALARELRSCLETPGEDASAGPAEWVKTWLEKERG